MLLLGSLGLSYFRYCLLMLAAPGIPIEFRYEAPAGMTTLRASSYLVDLGNGVVILRRPSLTDPSGQLVAACESLVVTNLDWRRGGSQIPHVEISNLTGRIVRRADGSFPLEDLLPSNATGASGTPFEAVVRNAKVSLTDMESGPWGLDVSTRMVRVSGRGSAWIARCAADIAGIGHVRTVIEKSRRVGYVIHADSGKLDLSRVVAHALRMRPLVAEPIVRNLHIGSVQVSGPFVLLIPKGKRWFAQGHLRATSDDVRYGEYDVRGLTFTGDVGTRGANGFAQFVSGSTRGQFRGSCTWLGGALGGGKISVAADSRADLPGFITRLTPTGLSFRRGRYDGWVSFGRGLQTQSRGALVADQVDYKGERATGVAADVMASPTTADLTLLRGSTEGVRPTAAVRVDVKSGGLRGYLSVPEVTSDEVARFTPTHGVTGEGSLTASLGGSIADPSFLFTTAGAASYRHGSTLVGPDRFDLTGTYHKGSVVVTRGSLGGESGQLAIDGSRSAAGTLSVYFEARDVKPSFYDPAISGVLDAEGQIGGTLEQPRFKGRIEGSNLAYKKYTLPAAAIDFSGNREFLFLDSASAVSGTASLEGAATIGLHERSLAGTFRVSGLSTTEFLGDGFAGLIDVPDIKLGGTLDHPVATARLTGTNLVAQDVAVASLEGLLQVTRDGVRLDHATAAVAEGDISATGQYRFADNSGQIKVSTTSLTLDKLAPALGESVTIGGTTSVKQGNFSYANGALSGQAEGEMEQVMINGAPAGDGNWSADVNGSIVHGSLSIGQLLPQLRVVDAEVSYDMKAKTFNGTFDADHARIRDLAAASARYLPAAWTADPQKLDSLSGDLTVGSGFSGTLKSPEVQLRTLEASNLTFGGRSFGTLSGTDIVRSGSAWKVPGIRLTGPSGDVSLSGSLTEGGPMSLKLSAKGFHLASLSPFLASLENNAGTADLDLSGSGDAEHPEIVGQAHFYDLAKPPAIIATSTNGDPSLDVNFPNISLSKSMANIRGTYTYSGFSGSLNLSAPFNPETGFGDGSLTGKVVLDERKLSDLPLLNSYLDPARSSGTFGGDIEVTGPIGDLAFSGGLKLKADSLGIRFTDPKAYVKKIDDSLKAVDATVGISHGHTLSVSVSANEERGGKLSANVSAPLVDLSAALRESSDEILRQHLDAPISGQIKLERLAMRQTAPDGYVALTADGSVNISGSVSKPSFGTPGAPGMFDFTGVDSRIPTLPTALGEASTPTIDPSFNVNMNLKEPARVNSATAELALSGGGSLRGSLSDPQAKAGLSVERGTIRLPGGTVRLEKGGSVDFDYRRGFAKPQPATLAVDLTGHTNITTVGYGVGSQRYDVTLFIRGDLLAENALQIDADSDAPDLSSEDVLGLLGARDLFVSLGSNTTAQSDAERRVASALGAFALPSLADPVTSTLAKFLDLDYVSLDYSDVDQATVSTARTLTPELSVQYRQQVGSPAAGYRGIYDLKLVYSPRRLPKALRRFSLSFGADQDNPWKVAVEYGLRFGPTSGTEDKHRSVISP